jgi:hypothetical protein
MNILSCMVYIVIWATKRLCMAMPWDFCNQEYEGSERGWVHASKSSGIKLEY